MQDCKLRLMLNGKSRVTCECNSDIVDCQTHGNPLTAKIIGRLAGSRFQSQLGRYHVTELCGCLRCSYLERKYGHEESYKEVWVKQRGKALHRQLSYAFEGWKELPIRLPIHLDDEDIEVIGHIDAYDPERAEMTEFKSTRFVNWQKKNKILPHRHHVEQLQSYFSIWTSVYRLPVKKLFIAYMDDQTPPERFEIEPHDVTARLEERAIQLHNSLLQDAAPAADPSSLCHYCPFEASCRY